MNTSTHISHINYAVQHTVNIHKTVEKKRYDLFYDKMLDLCSQVFSPMYYNIFSKYWNTSLDARMKRGYFVNNRTDGVYEIYVPTQASLENNMQYYRITIKVLPEVDYGIVDAETKTLVAAKQVEPNGVIDSELFAFIAPRRSQQASGPQVKDQKGNTCKKGKFLRGFRHVKKVGYLTAIIISSVPEVCMKRLLLLIATFLKRRIKRLLKKLGYDDPWQTDYKREEYFYYSPFNTIIESKFGIHISSTLRCFSHSYSWIRDWVKRVKRSLYRQDKVREEIRQLDKVKMLFKALNMPISREIAIKESILLTKARHCYWLKPPLTHQEWQNYKPKNKLKLNPLEAACLRVDLSTDIKEPVIVRVRGEKGKTIHGYGENNVKTKSSDPKVN